MCSLSYSFLLRVYIFVFRAMSHELFGEQVKGASSTYTQSEGNWTGVQRYAYLFQKDVIRGSQVVVTLQL